MPTPYDQDMFDPRTALLLGMGSGLLQASGPSKRPVSLGQAMGVGLEQGMLSSGRAAQLQVQMKEAQALEEYRKAQAQKMQQEQTSTADLMAIAQRLEPHMPGITLMARVSPQEAAKRIGDVLYPGQGKLERIETLGPDKQPGTQFVRPQPGAFYPSAPKDVNMQRAELPVEGKQGWFQNWSLDPKTQQPVAKIGAEFEKKPLATATAIADAGGKAQPAFYTELGKESAKDFQARRALARDAQSSLAGIGEARKLLDSGMITGIGADYVVGFGKALQKAGVNYNADAIANSEAFVAAQAKQVAQIIKAFGAGTGLSDADREFAIKAAAGSISMNEASIRRVLDINERAFRNVITVFNKEAGSIPQGTLPYSMSVDQPEKTVTRRGTYQGRKVVEYSDGSVEFENGGK